VASRVRQRGASVTGATQRHLEEMKMWAGDHELPGGPSDRGLTETKQRRIIDGASKMLFEKGFHGTSIRDIAAACDMSMGQLYHYISSKDDILYLMHLYSQERWHQHLADARFDQITDPIAKLEYGLRISIRYLLENRDLIQFLYTESKYLEPEYLQKVLELNDQNVVGFYRHLLSEIPGLSREEAESGRVASLVSYVCEFLSLRGWNLNVNSAADLDSAADFLVTFVLRGLGIDCPRVTDTTKV
jgi:AcrR family transcriptional regulator